MKRTALIALLIALGLLLVAALPGAAKSPPGFAGKWVGEDVDDGSTVLLDFKKEKGSEGTVFHIKFTDDRCFVCDDEPVKGRGVGVLLSPEEMEAAQVFWGLGSSDAVFGPLSVTYLYDPDTDTVTDPTGAIFDRVVK